MLFQFHAPMLWCTMKKFQLYGLCLKRYNEDVFQGEVS